MAWHGMAGADTGFNLEERTGRVPWWRVLPDRDDGLHYENWWGLPSPESLPPELSQVRLVHTPAYPRTICSLGHLFCRISLVLQINLADQ